MASGRDFVGPFQLVRLIRSGQTTQVWEAIKDGQKERVALKILHNELSKDKSEIEQLKLETLVAKTLDHDNVIKIFDFHGDFGRPFISMQLFNARNLKLELRDNPDIIEQNLSAIITGAGEGLQHLHERGWIHCDIKPDNFLVDENANVKLIDFSIAQKAKSGFKFLRQRPKSIRGTRSYMAPEQIRRRALDFRTDIYSFGCVLFELVARRTPYSAPNPDELLYKHLRAPVPTLQSVDGRVTVEFAALVMRMMAKDRAKRPSSVRDFLLEYSRMQLFRAGTRRKLV